MAIRWGDGKHFHKELYRSPEEEILLGSAARCSRERESSVSASAATAGVSVVGNRVRKWVHGHVNILLLTLLDTHSSRSRCRLSRGNSRALTTLRTREVRRLRHMLHGIWLQHQQEGYLLRRLPTTRRRRVLKQAAEQTKEHRQQERSVALAADKSRRAR